MVHVFVLRICVVDAIYGALNRDDRPPVRDNYSCKQDIDLTGRCYSGDYVTMTSYVQVGQSGHVLKPGATAAGVLRQQFSQFGFTQEQVACVCEVRCRIWVHLTVSTLLPANQSAGHLWVIRLQSGLIRSMLNCLLGLVFINDGVSLYQTSGKVSASNVSATIRSRDFFSELVSSRS